MILLLGSSGYVGSAFKKELEARGVPFVTATHDKAGEAMDCPDVDFVINCAAFIPKRSVSECDKHQRLTIEANVLFPQCIAKMALYRDIPIAHLSTGCLWNDSEVHTETDPPQREFKGHCGFYIGTKLMSEDLVRVNPKHYIFRIRLPFDEFDGERNYLSKLANFDSVWDHENSLSHRGDTAKACLDLIENKAEFGTYHVMNPGTVHAKDIVYRMMEMGIRKESPLIVNGKAGGSIVSVDKLINAGVKMRPVEDALLESLDRWLTKT